MRVSSQLVQLIDQPSIDKQKTNASHTFPIYKKKHFNFLPLAKWKSRNSEKPVGRWIMRDGVSEAA